MAAPTYPLLGGFTEKEYLRRVAEWLVYCFKGLGEDMARERVEHAMTLAIPGGPREWTLKSKYPYPVHVSFIVRDLDYNAYRRKEHDNAPLDGAHHELPDKAPSPEELLLRRERRKRIGTALLERFADSPTVLPWLGLVLAGELSNEEISQKRGVSHDQVIKARARVKSFLDTWYAEHGDEVDSGQRSLSA